MLELEYTKFVSIARLQRVQCKLYFKDTHVWNVLNSKIC